MRRGRRTEAVLLVAGLAVVSVGWTSDLDRLLYHVETEQGEVVVADGSDLLFNPASIIKVGTSWWALDRLGPEYRFSTTVGFLGRLDPEGDRIRGDLVVAGGGDPDFHHENAFLVARELNRVGIRRVDGDLVVTGTFWMGWENGAARPKRSPTERALVMGQRFRDALDTARWDGGERQAWKELCDRRGWNERSRWSVEIRGGVRVADSLVSQTLITHQSNPLRVTLRRFNVYSNNDIVRIAEGLGGVRGLETFLLQRLGLEDGQLDLSTASGQERNRMTPRAVVAMLRGFGGALRDFGMTLDDVLAIPGCDPGPTRSMFPKLVSGPDQRAVVGKTGTLTTTDGGVVAFAGSFSSRDRGEILFCVGAPKSGWSINRWRRVEEAWLLDLVAGLGGAAPRTCGPELAYPDTSVELVRIQD